MKFHIHRPKVCFYFNLLISFLSFLNFIFCHFAYSAKGFVQSSGSSPLTEYSHFSARTSVHISPFLPIFLLFPCPIPFCFSSAFLPFLPYFPRAIPASTSFFQLYSHIFAFRNGNFKYKINDKQRWQMDFERSSLWINLAWFFG